MKKLALAIQEKLDQIDFEECWPGFHIFPFALYNEELAYLNGQEIKKPDSFYGNTALLYHDDLIAIWKIDKDSLALNIDVLTSKIIHEMFHAFQQELGEQRFPNELKALDYSYDCVNLSMKYLEAAKLKKLYNNFTEKTFEEVLTSLNYRKEHYPFEFTYESKIETVEGMAQYVELEALKQLDPARYHEKIFKVMDYIEHIDNYKNIRFLSYDFGTLLMLIINKYNLSFDYSLTSSQTIAEQLLNNSFDGDSKPYCKAEFKDLIQSIYHARKELIKGILDAPHDTKKLNHQLYGFDPLNTFKEDQYIYCKDFAGIYGDEMTWLRGEMILEIDDEGTLIMIYTKKSANA